MIQLTHLRVLLRWGGFCSFVVPSTSALSLSRTVISSWLKATVAEFGIGCGTGLDKLHGGDRGLGGDGGELDEAFGGFELTIFERSLKFQQSPELLDGPAHPVPIDDLPSGLDIGDVVVVSNRQ